jgi:hypothetical protein
MDKPGELLAMGAIEGGGANRIPEREGEPDKTESGPTPGGAARQDGCVAVTAG